MTNTHDQIHAHFVEMCEKSDFVHTFPNVHDKSYFLKTCFLNYTPHHLSLRLTSIGHTILKHMYECWSWPVLEQDRMWLLRGYTLVQLHHKMLAPYYWDSKTFYVYHSEHAMEYEMVSRDFCSWLKAQ
jgi:hypothetical protein